jgi:hypothetical protein
VIKELSGYNGIMVYKQKARGIVSEGFKKEKKRRREEK